MGRVTRSSRGKAALRAFAALAATGVSSVAMAAIAAAAEPHPWQFDLQPAATPVAKHIKAFNDELTVVIVAISLLVFVLIGYVIVRFNARRNPVPTRTEHNLLIEILWTVVPALILVFIAFPSFKLMYFEARVPKDAMTINITGHQWYWSYAYPGEGNLSFDSNYIHDADLKSGDIRLLSVDNPLVVPVGTDVRVFVASTDVIHSWFVPSFGVQEYAMPGRHNEAWFRVDHIGTYYGECNQICGINHAFMPIEVQVISKDDFKKWVASAKQKFAANRLPAVARPGHSVAKLADANGSTRAGLRY
jgi:cytochrome c oxidase subunit 2